MKTLFGALCWLLLAAVGCEDELPQLAQIEKGKETIAFAVGTGTRTVKIETTHPWTATSSQSWLTVSPAKGAAGQSELTLTADANTTTTARSATVTVKVGHKEATIKVSQAEKESLELDKESETVGWMAGTCLFTVSANVDDYVVESNADWLRETSLREMTDRDVVLEYDENPTYEPRTAKVTVKREGMSAIFSVTQGGRGALYFVLERAEVAADATEYALKLMKNTDANGLELIDDADWLSLTDDKLRAMPAEETVMLTLLPNTSTTPREAQLVVNDNTTGTLLTDTFTLVQLALEDFLRLEQTAYAVEAEGKELSIPVEASGAFEVKMEAEAAAWITGSEGTQLPGKLQFEVAENTQAEPRTATVTLSLKENPTTEATVTITQAAAEVPVVDKIPKLYNLLGMATTIETEPINLGGFKATVSYDTGDATGWLSNINNNSGKLHFEVSDNLNTSKRSATMHLVPEQGEPIEIRVNQSGSDGAYIELAKPGTLASYIELKHSRQYKKLRLVAPQGINADDFNTIRNATLAVEEADLQGVRNLTVLPDGAFKGCKTMKKVQLPTGVATIGVEAFAGCLALEGVPVSSSLKQIGKRAFAGAFTGSLYTTLDLTTATALTTIDEGAFEDCNTLLSLKLPAALTTLGNSAFSKCYSLEGTLELPAALATIGSEAFQNCNNLGGTLTLPDNVTILGARAFMMCTKLTKLTMLTTSLTAIGEEAFKGCELLGSADAGNLTISSGVKRIERSAFEKTGVKTLDLPATLEVIGNGAFFNCNDLEVVTCRKTGIPPALDADNPKKTFGGVSTVASLLVPDEASVVAYKADALWKEAIYGWTVDVITR